MKAPITAKNTMAIPDGSGGEVGELAPLQLQLAQYAGIGEVEKEIFNIDIWCIVFEKVST
jgi:hypothetical protein